MSFLLAAKKLIAKNLSIIPTDEVKRSIIPWKIYQERFMSNDEIDLQFSKQKVKGLAIICGSVSNNLEVIDIDSKYDITGQLYENYTAAIKEHSAALYNKLPIIQTRGLGYHIYYRCEFIEGNQKLSQRPATAAEIKSNPNEKVKVLIETRGEAGYVIAPPSPGYKFIQTNDIPVITLDEREILIELARSFNEVIAAPERPKPVIDQKQYGLSPFEDYNMRGDSEQLLSNHGWTYKYERGGKRYYCRPGKNEGISGSYWPERRWFGVFTTSSEFDTNKAYSPVGVYALLECNNDFSLCAKRLLDAGYGEKRVSYGKLEGDVLKKKRDGEDNESIKAYLHKNYEQVKSVEQAEEIINKIERQQGEIISTFWDVKFDEEGKVKNVTINRYKFQRFLSSDGGFYLYFYDKNSSIFKLIQEKEGLVREVSTEQIKKFVKNYIQTLPDSFDGITKEVLMEIILKGTDTYFSKSFLEFLERKEIDFLKDTSTHAYFPFKNGVIVITKDGYEIKSYGQLKKTIWASQVIDFYIDIIPASNASDAEFSTFVQKVCNDDLERTERAFTIIGYLLHKYKDPSKPYAVILSEETEDEKKGGGTGKGIFVKAIMKMINTVTVDGKTFKNDKGFLWQRVDLDTKLLFIDDAKRNFDFESLYSVITEGITVEKKNKDEIHISFDDSPKVVVTTNYSISQNGNHAKRRQQILEFGSFFTPENTPLHHFGHRLYDDWDKDEYNRFYNLMFWCISHHLLIGIKNVDNSETLKRKHIRLGYTEDFINWWDEYSGNGFANYKEITVMHNDFLKVADMDKKEYSRTRFKKGLTEAAESFGFELIEKLNDQTRRKEIKMAKLPS